MVSSEKSADVRPAAPIQLPHAQRSSSEKWSSNQQLTLEYAKRQKMSIAWIERKLGCDVFANADATMGVQRDDENALFVLLRSGVVLRELMEALAPAHANKMPIARTYSKLLAPWKERENISIFLHDCRMLGMAESSMFCTDDLYEGTNMVQVLFGLQYIQSWFHPQSGLSPRSTVSSPRCMKPGETLHDEVHDMIELLPLDDTLGQVHDHDQENEMASVEVAASVLPCLEEDSIVEAVAANNDDPVVCSGVDDDDVALETFEDESSPFPFMEIESIEASDDEKSKVTDALLAAVVATAPVIYPDAVRLQPLGQTRRSTTAPYALQPRMVSTTCSVTCCHVM